MRGNYVNCPVGEGLTRVTGGTNAVARTIFATVATGIAVIALAGPAPARPPFPINQAVGVANCSQPEGQLCPGIPSAVIDPRTPTVKVEFTANGEHCSDIIAHIIVDGHEWGSNVVAPGQSDGGYEIPLGPGQHNIGVQGEGITGGCNTGKLASWGGQLHIEEIGDPYRGDGAVPPPA
jgi:hypothetical protein